jgi:hypothetical protein
VFSETVVGLDHQDFLGFIFHGLPGTRELRNNRDELLGETWLRRRAH